MAFRIVWNIYRFELASVILALVALVVVAGVQVTRLDGARPSLACSAAAVAGAESEVDEAGCPDPRTWNSLNREREQLPGVFLFLPLLSGALLGSVVVSREIEQGTTQLAWSLGASRRRWLADRLIVVGGPLVIVLIMLAVAGNALEGASAIGVDPRVSLSGYGERDVALIVRTLAAFALALLAGALLGRQLPAAVVGVLLSLMLYAGLGAAFPYGAQPRLAEPALIDAETPFEREAAILARQVMRALDGVIYDVRVAAEMVPSGLAEGERLAWTLEHFEGAEYRFTGDQLTEIELREAGLLGILAVLAVGATFVVVERHEPS